MPGRGGEAYHCRTPITGNPYMTLANPTKLGFTHEIYYAWATSWFKLRSIIAWSGFVWIIRLGIIISTVAIFKDRDVLPGHICYFWSSSGVLKLLNNINSRVLYRPKHRLWSIENKKLNHIINFWMISILCLCEGVVKNIHISGLRKAYIDIILPVLLLSPADLRCDIF